MRTFEQISTVCLGSLALFVPAALFLPREILASALNGIFLTIGFTIVYFYWPGLKDAFASREFRRAHYLLMSLAIVWIDLIIRFIYFWVMELTDVTGRMDNLFILFINLLVILSGVIALLLMFMPADGGPVERKGWLVVASTTFVGVLAGMAARTLRWFLEV